MGFTWDYFQWRIRAPGVVNTLTSVASDLSQVKTLQLQQRQRGQ